MTTTNDRHARWGVGNVLETVGLGTLIGADEQTYTVQRAMNGGFVVRGNGERAELASAVDLAAQLNWLGALPRDEDRAERSGPRPDDGTSDDGGALGATTATTTPRRLDVVIREALGESDGDSWGWAMSGLFAVADVLAVRDAALIPAEWKYRAAPGLSEERIWDDDGYAGMRLLELLDDGSTTTERVLSAGRVLNRYVDLLRAAGREY